MPISDCTFVFLTRFQYEWQHKINWRELNIDQFAKNTRVHLHMT